MNEIWLDAQISPSVAAWINRTYADVTARSVRDLGLRDADDRAIYQAARAEEVIVMTKDRDFISLLDYYGPPPDVIWVTCGNTSNRRMREILSETLSTALEILQGESALVEIDDR